MSLVRLRHVAEVDPVKSEVGHLSGDTKVSFLPMAEVGYGEDLVPQEARLLEEVYDGYTYLREGDVAIATISPSFQNGKGGVLARAANGICFATTELTVIRPGPEIHPRYLLYVLQSHDFIEGGIGALRGVAGQQRVPTDFLRDVKIRLPAWDEQERLVNSLEADVEHIGTVIGKNVRMLELLEERRSSACHAAMSWKKTAPLKRLLDSVVGGEWGSEAGSEEVDVRCFRAADFDRHWHLLTEDRVPVRSVTQPQLSSKRLRVGDLVLEKSGGGPTTPVGCAALVTAEVLGDEPAVCSNFTARLRPVQNVEPRFLQLLLASLHRTGGLVPHIKQTTGIQNLDLGAVLQLRVPYPPETEQRRIADDVYAEWQRMDEIADRLRRQIALFTERRRVLITESVAGGPDFSEVA